MGSDNERYFCFLLVCVLVATTAGKKHKTQPNIVMIVADDLGWDDVSFHGSSQIPTPHIDRLANEGVILNSYYVSPICTPTRASFMTGKHPVNLGIQHATIFGTQPYGLPLRETTTPQYMKSLGYKTHGIGKWHLGFFEKEYTPTYRGFDSYYGFWNGKEDYWDHTSQEDVWGTDLRDNEKPVRNETGHYGTELFTERAVQVINNHNQSKPLYLYLAQQAVHSANEREPLQAPAKLVEKFKNIRQYDRRIYAGMVTALDESVGKVYKALNKSGMLDNTVLVFTTDNGGAPRGFNWNQGCNYPLKGGKDSFWEGGVRAVGFVHSNLIKKKARVSTKLIDATDWLPTFYHLGGGDVSLIQDRVDGMNLWDTISQDASSPRNEILHNIDPIRKFAAIRVNNYKLIVNQDAVYHQRWHPRYSEENGKQNNHSNPKTLPGAVVDCGHRNSGEKECNTTEFPCLFDISKDPCEYNTIARDNLQIVRKLLERLIQIQKQARPVWFPKRDPKANPSNLDDFWGPWRDNPANTKMINDAESKIPSLLSQKDCHGNLAHVNHTDVIYRNDAEFHSLLRKILHKAKTEKKANKGRKEKKAIIYKDENSRIKESMVRLYNEMEEKTKDKEDLKGRLTRKIRSLESTINADPLNFKFVKKNRKSRNNNQVKTKVNQESNLLSLSKEDTVGAIVKQSIKEKHTNSHKTAHVEKDHNTNDLTQDSTFSNIIHDIEGNSETFFTDYKEKKAIFRVHRRSEIPPKPKQSRKQIILSALSKVFEK